MKDVLLKIVPYAVTFLGAVAVTLVLTPIVREMNRFFGMVDHPDARRINKTPIPRGGGLAVVLGVGISYLLVLTLTKRPVLQYHGEDIFCRMSVLAASLAALGYIDDKFGLPAKLKLLGQVIVAFFTWFWAGLGFGDLWPQLPVWLNCALTVFWIVGAVNAFNLIDGLDGLASGIGLIAILGMAGSLFIIDTPQTTLFHFAFAGALVGFLYYNYNPASVFLGDCGSMYIGFVISTLPLATHTSSSMMVSVGMPLLAMGVPIFDTALAIIRRSIRRFLNRRDGASTAGNDRVMTADADHLHHRILRTSGFNQRKAAWILYLFALALVCTGLVGTALRSRSGGLWLLAVAVAAVVVFKDMARIELFDAGRLLNALAHDTTIASRRRRAKLAVPFYLVFDVFALIATFFFVCWLLDYRMTLRTLRTVLPIRVTSVFGALVLFRAYVTVWPRAMMSNYVRLLVACVFGSILGSSIIYYAPHIAARHLPAMTILYASVGFIAIVFVRVLRGCVRDLFYALDCSRLKTRRDVSRMLVYGTGLRYRAFRRELVRSAAANDRIIVGLLDDDILLRGRYIGGLRVMGTLHEAPEIINELNADTVVIACCPSEERLRTLRDLLAPIGVRITLFGYEERPLDGVGVRIPAGIAIQRNFEERK